MENNVGKVDKIVRVILAIVFFGLGYTYNYWFYLIGAALLVTVGTGFCWPYKLFGINTCKVKK